MRRAHLACKRQRRLAPRPRGAREVDKHELALVELLAGLGHADGRRAPQTVREAPLAPLLVEQLAQLRGKLRGAEVVR